MARLRLLIGLVTLGLAAVVANANVTELSSHRQRIVVFEKGTTPAQRLSIAKSAGGEIIRELKFINAVVIRVENQRVRPAELKLLERSEVTRIDDDPKINWLEARPQTLSDIQFPGIKNFVTPFSLSKEAQPPSETVQDIPWGIARVKASEAWSKTGGEGVKVVVIDTGIDFDHPDLKVVGGWSAVDKENPANYKDDNGHGSHVAGTIAALNDDKGVVGVAPKATLYGVKVLDANGSGTFSDVIAGMEWAVTNKMQVANMSLGASRGNASLEAAVNAMVDGGVTLIAAAGNSGGSVGFPAAYEGAIAIAASDSGDRVAYFSSRGPEVDFIAPGVSVRSTYMGGEYSSLSGTSMACPHAVGLAALAVAAHGLTTPAQVRAALSAASVKFPDVPVEQQGAGLPMAPALVK